MGAQISEILTALINEIAGIEDDFVLGIDNYHVITEVPISDGAAVVEWMLVLARERVI